MGSVYEALAVLKLYVDEAVLKTHRFTCFSLLSAGIKGMYHYTQLILFSLSFAHYLAQAGLQLKILSPQHSKYWDYRNTPPHLAQFPI